MMMFPIQTGGQASNMADSRDGQVEERASCGHRLKGANFYASVSIDAGEQISWEDRGAGKQYNR